MKICFISTLYPPAIIGGAEIVAQKTADNLSKKGHQVSIITTSKNRKIRKEIINNIKIYRLPLNIYSITEFRKQHIIKRALWHLIELFNVSAYIKIKRILEKEAPDLVHIHDYKGLSVLSFKAVKDLNLPLIFTAHDYTPICIRSNLLNGKGQICKNKKLPCKIYSRVRKFIIDHKPDVIIAPSKFVLEKLESEGLFKNSRKIVIPNPTEPKNENSEKTYDIIDILFVGSLSKHKGPDILIQSFKKVKGDNLRLHIVGTGPCLDKLKKLAGKDKRIIFHGFLRGEKLMDMYKMANVTVVPSIWYDNSPMVIYESFMCSTPVIASRIGGIPELVKDGYNGFLFEPGSVDELTKILNEISENPMILKKLEKNAHKSSKKYDIKRHINSLEKIYTGLIEERRG
ncbi:MAG: glycosyltransferase family 4 protein [Methanothermobacter sp.]|nr:glycosyltransferase family 4 protein [Methanothermobacter sp.]